MHLASSRTLIGRARRRRASGALLLAAALAAPGALAQTALQPALDALERTPLHERDKSLSNLRALLPRAQSGSAEHLELLYQIGHLTLDTQASGGLAALEASFEPWRRGERLAQGRVAWALLKRSEALRAGNAALARTQLSALDDVQPASLPPRWRWRLLMQRAEFVQEDGDLDTALVHMLEALRAAQELGRTSLLVRTRTQLSFLYLQRHENERAAETIDQAQRDAEREPSDALMLDLLGSRGLVESELERYAAARDSMTQAVALAKRLGDTTSHVLHLGNLADVHLKARDYTQALRVTEEALPLARALKDQPSEMLALGNMGLAKIALGRVAEGKRDAEQALAMERAGGHLTYLAAALKELAGYLERAGDLPGALKAYEEYRTLADTQARDDRRQAVVEAQQQFDDAQRAAEAKLLGQNNALQAEQIRARRLQHALWGLLLACGAALVGLVGLLSRRTRLANAALVQTNRALAEQGERDPLTGLGNRHLLQRLLRDPGQSEGLRGALFLVDIDHFKQINDQYGHAGGDRVLVELAQRLRHATREGDALLRWGGEEFLVLAQVADVDAAHRLAERVLASVGSEPIALEADRSVRVTVSMGLARFPLEGAPSTLPWEAALELVDQLMYRAKARGRNQAWLLRAGQGDSLEQLLALLRRTEGEADDAELRLTQLRGPAVAAGAAR